jgi:hypothetical protein
MRLLQEERAVHVFEVLLRSYRSQNSADHRGHNEA